VIRLAIKPVNVFIPIGTNLRRAFLICLKAARDEAAEK
jgi:hypothetical protein